MSEKKGLVNYNDLDLDDQQNDIKLKKHNDLKLSASSATELFISYTYRF